MFEQMKYVKMGQRFRLNGKEYVKIPEMNYNIGNWGCVSNCFILEESDDEMIPPTIKATYLMDSVVVFQYS